MPSSFPVYDSHIKVAMGNIALDFDINFSATPLFLHTETTFYAATLEGEYGTRDPRHERIRLQEAA